MSFKGSALELLQEVLACAEAMGCDTHPRPQSPPQGLLVEGAGPSEETTPEPIPRDWVTGFLSCHREK